jgi:hypothetical protein
MTNMLIPRLNFVYVSALKQNDWVSKRAAKHLRA